MQGCCDQRAELNSVHNQQKSDMVKVNARKLRTTARYVPFSCVRDFLEPELGMREGTGASSGQGILLPRLGQIRYQ